jgi:TetR/AcrR family transcriptional regulator, regulator of cefoperazone and chloramphenicol sensitivity
MPPSKNAAAGADQTTAAKPVGVSDARERLLMAALKLFAERGFAQASTRDIAAKAGVNIGLISYYFGDKQGLYSAAFTEPVGRPTDDIELFTQSDQTLEEALFALYTRFLLPLKLGPKVQWCLRLHYREMSEPTGVWAEEVNAGIVPYQKALQQLLRRHLRPDQARDTDLQRLAMSIAALGVHAYVGRDVSQAINPALMADAQAIDAQVAHNTRCALGMVRAFSQPLSATP